MSHSYLIYLILKPYVKGPNNKTQLVAPERLLWGGRFYGCYNE